MPDSALGSLDVEFSRHRDRLERMIRFRLDPRLAARVDPDDILQDAYLRMTTRYERYRADPAVPLFVWLRRMAWQTLIDVHRAHLGRQKDPAREALALGEAISQALTAVIVAEHTSPSGAAVRREEGERVATALASLDDLDREVLALRHFEQMRNGEVAALLGISKTAASNRYVRAVGRIGAVLSSLDEAQRA